MSSGPRSSGGADGRAFASLWRERNATTARREGGATLIEVLVSVALVVVGLLGVYAAYTASVRAASHGNRTTQATARAARQMEILRNAPTAAIQCLAAGNPSIQCATVCCMSVLDAGGTGCVPTDAGVAAAICQLTPLPETDASGTTYTFEDPVVRPSASLPFLYEVTVQVTYTLPGETMGGSDVRRVALHSQLYKP